MRVTRRTFVQVGTVGAAGLLASCNREPAQPAAGAPGAARTTPFKLRIQIGGGFAMVFANNGKLACGSVDLSYVAGCHVIPHVSTLRLINGRVTTDTTGITPVPSPAGDYIQHWPIEAKTTLSMTEGGGSTPIVRPTFNTLAPGAGETLPTPADDAAWNDWRHTFTPSRHHANARLHPEWRKRMNGLIELANVDLRVDPPTQSCAKKGRFGAAPKAMNDAGYDKPITDSLFASATSSDRHVRFVIETPPGAPAKELIIEPVGDVVQLMLKMEPPPGSPAPTPFSYKKDAPLDHAAMFYALVEPSVACTDQLIPLYLGFPEGSDCRDSGQGGSDPGGYCPGGSYTEP